MMLAGTSSPPTPISVMYSGAIATRSRSSVAYLRLNELRKSSRLQAASASMRAAPRTRSPLRIDSPFGRGRTPWRGARLRCGPAAGFVDAGIVLFVIFYLRRQREARERALGSVSRGLGCVSTRREASSCSEPFDYVAQRSAARGAEVVVTALVIRDAAAIANAEPIGDLGLREGEPLSDSAQLVPIAVAVGGRACT